MVLPSVPGPCWHDVHYGLLAVYLDDGSTWPDGHELQWCPLVSIEGLGKPVVVAGAVDDGIAGDAIVANGDHSAVTPGQQLAWDNLGTFAWADLDYWQRREFAGAVAGRADFPPRWRYSTRFKTVTLD